MKKIDENIYTKITNKVENVIINNKLITTGDKIIVAVSGGPDSMCLLSVLNDLKSKFNQKYNIKYSLIVAHVNHMIREVSNDEKLYVEEFCKKIQVPFFYLKKDVVKLSKKLKLSEETCGRKVRYDFFNEILIKENAMKIAVAHNLDDNVETIMLNIIRGCGLKGLTGMDYKFENIIRPLLDIEKKYILQYNEIENLNPCFDITNEQVDHDRNKIRNILIPELKCEYNKNILDNITRMKKILSLDEDFLQQFCEIKVKENVIKMCDDKIEVNYQNILKEHMAIQQRCIRQIIKMKIKNLDGIENIHILDILKLLENNIKGKKYIIGNKFTIQIVKKYVAVIY
ncbi:MAG: tRNA lysidine(34) synthetase TilS [Clostridia bacterium]